MILLKEFNGEIKLHSGAKMSIKPSKYVVLIEAEARVVEETVTRTIPKSGGLVAPADQSQDRNQVRI